MLFFTVYEYEYAFPFIYVLNLLIFDVASCSIWARGGKDERSIDSPLVSNFQPHTYTHTVQNETKTIDLLSSVDKKRAHQHTHT